LSGSGTWTGSLNRSGDCRRPTRTRPSGFDLSEQGFEKKYILRRSDGTSVYSTRDLAYHTWKGRNADRMIDVLGADHKLIGAQLQATLELLGEQPPEIVYFEFVSSPRVP